MALGDTTRLKVLIADDSAIIRERLQALVAEVPGVEGVGFAEDSEGVLEQVGRTGAEVLLLDLIMPGRGGLETLTAVLDQYPGCRVIVVTNHAGERCRQRCLEAGAHGFVDKSGELDRLVGMLREEAEQRRPGGTGKGGSGTEGGAGGAVDSDTPLPSYA